MHRIAWLCSKMPAAPGLPTGVVAGPKRPGPAVPIASAEDFAGRYASMELGARMALAVLKAD